jgi:hypothetical protein
MLEIFLIKIKISVDEVFLNATLEHWKWTTI